MLDSLKVSLNVLVSAAGNGQHDDVFRAELHLGQGAEGVGAFERRDDALEAGQFEGGFDRFVVIDKGELVGSFKQSDFDKKEGASEIVLQTDDVVKAKDVVEEIFGAKATFVGDGKISFTTERTVSEIAKELVLHDVNVLGINKKETSLEEFFLKVTEKEDK